VTHVIAEDCIGVKGQSCMEVCPASCIFTEPADHMSYIDPARCTDCGECVSACVIGAIYPDTKIPLSSREFININEAWFKRKTGTRKRVREIANAIGEWLPPDR
jgi:Fe-S-cluster-containing hydrogenase component 2